MSIKVVVISSISILAMGVALAAKPPAKPKTVPMKTLKPAKLKPIPVYPVAPTKVPGHIITPAKQCTVTVALAGSVYGVPALATNASGAGGESYANGSYDMQINAWNPTLNSNELLAYIPDTIAAFNKPILACQNSPYTCVAKMDSADNLLKLTFDNVPCGSHRIVFNTKFVSTNGQPLTTSSSFNSTKDSARNIFSPQVVMQQSEWDFSTKYFNLTKGTPYTVNAALGRQGCGSTKYCRDGNTGSASSGYCYWNESTFQSGPEILGIRPKSTNCNSDD